ncbi:cyclophilin-like fold protein [Metabacillus indicus]|uniref:cyclophilin-like fold protein n=1 Tax=Metabacillus indicus TaxID=246786 RepID=UPI0019D32AD7|nr:cyclophilin-like fold protein [Metabacillus indicus]
MTIKRPGHSLRNCPLSINMNDHNRNEKFYNFSNALPEDSARPGEIRAGDIMLYGDNCLVLFYESFTSTYHYTRMGYIEDASRFAQAAGAGDVTAAFDQAENSKYHAEEK